VAGSAAIVKAEAIPWRRLRRCDGHPEAQGKGKM
jgi:hypothetical protein